MNPLELIEQFSQQSVLVIGDMMLDEYIWGTVSRISPEAPVPVVEVQNRTWIAGGAANTAANVASLGGHAIVLGLIGEDSSSDHIIQILQAKDIDTSPLLCDANRPTSTKTRVIAHGQQIVRYDLEQRDPIPLTHQQALLRRAESLMPTISAVVISDYGKGVITDLVSRCVIEIANRYQRPVIVDPKGVEYLKYRNATLIKPNQIEAGRVLNRELHTREEVLAAGAALIELLGPTSSLLVTRGQHGMALFEQSQSAVEIPAQAREVFDVTGAGDTVAGTLALVLASGGSLTLACQLASTAAAIVVGKVCTATCNQEELKKTYLGNL